MLRDQEGVVRHRGVYPATERLWGQLAQAGGGGWGWGEGNLCGRRGLWGWGLGGSQKKGPEPGRSRQVRVREGIGDAVR